LLNNFVFDQLSALLNFKKNSTNRNFSLCFRSLKIPWQTYLSELIGTALLVGVGLSFVILNFGTGSSVAAILPSAGVRRLLTGFLFGATGASIAISPIGKISGAHINPVVTLAFRIDGKLTTRDTIGFICAQFIGAVIGSIPLLLWRAQGRSIAFGGTMPGNGYSIWTALGGEIITTILLIVGLFTFLGHKKIRPYTPLLFPFLYAIMVWLEGPISGTSTNPARSFGPSVISGNWSGWWIYFVGPLAGMFIGLAIQQLSGLKKFRIEIAKVYHFHHDRYGIFQRGKQGPRNLSSLS
jgi:aquaporin Z